MQNICRISEKHACVRGDRLPTRSSRPAELTIIPEGENDSPASVSSKRPQLEQSPLSFHTKQPRLWWPVNLTVSPSLSGGSGESTPTPFANDNLSVPEAFIFGGPWDQTLD